MARHEVEGFNLRPLDAHQPPTLLSSSKSCGDHVQPPSSSQSSYGSRDRAKVKEWIAVKMHVGVTLACETFELETKAEWRQRPDEAVNLDLIASK